MRDRNAFEPVLPLENGDRLKRAEFERRYDAMPGVKKAELIEGVVYMPSPAGLRRHGGVREYVVWRVQDRKVDWFVLSDGEFIRLDPDEKGHYRSQTFPGLWLDAIALVEGGLAKVLDVVRQELAAPEHAKFVSDLAARSSSPRP